MYTQTCMFICHQLYKAGFREDDEVCFYWRSDSQAPVSSQYRADLPLYTFTLIHQTTGGFNLLPQTLTQPPYHEEIQSL